ncbi:MAG: hypothetical protein U0264_04805 [Candidatus Kapaibacterium sp.]
MNYVIPLLAIGIYIIVVGFKQLNKIRSTRPWTYWGVIIVSCFLFLFAANEFLRRKIGGIAGSYPFVEYWDIQASEGEVIEAIEQLHSVNPNFHPPLSVDFIDERDTNYVWTSNEMQEYLNKLKTDSLTVLTAKNSANSTYNHWLHINLYYPDTKEIVHTWTRPEVDETVTTFAFVSLSTIENPDEHRLINRDFWYVANNREISKFKTTFVDKIQEQILKNRNKGR